MSENRLKTTLSMKIDQSIADEFAQIEEKLKEKDETLTKNDIFTAVISEAKKGLSLDDVKLATREELRTIDHHVNRLKNTYLSIFNRADDFQKASENEIKELREGFNKLNLELKIERESYNISNKQMTEKLEEVEKEKNNATETLEAIKGSIKDKERAIANLEEKLKEMEEIRVENRALQKENKDFMSIKNKLENDLKYSNNKVEEYSDQIEKQTLEINRLHIKIENTIKEMQEGCNAKIEAINLENEKKLDNLRVKNTEKIDKEREEYNKREEKIRENYESKLEALRKEYESKLESQKIDLQNKHQEEASKIKKQK
ncbi:hypothetical protein [Senegalia sp. (in: firmicutes)]|uniref:hypothetical protein n=1 Tax=Senegalia sp. (in: firmicutes) TaxID=1924098 RepID=UPI003F9D200E